MLDADCVAAFDAERPVVDEPKAIGSASALRTTEQGPRPPVPELRVRQADQLPPVANLDDRVRRVELHHAGRAQPWDFHAQELVEKAAVICVGAALAHDAEATPRLRQAQSACRSARSRAGL